MKRKFQVQRLNTIKGKRLADIFNLNNDPYCLNDPANIKTLYNTEHIRNRLNSRLKLLQKSFVDRCDYELKQIIHTKLLNQSFYEKHIAIKILEIRNQKETFLNNRILEHELLLKNSNEDYLRQLYQQKHAIGLINVQNNLERNRIVELEKRLNDLKLNQEYKEHYNICSQIISDVVDLSVNFSTYGRKITSDFTNLFWQQWSTRVQDVSTMITNIDSIIYVSEKDSGVNRLSIGVNGNHGNENKGLNGDVEMYLCLKWPWDIEVNDDANKNNSLNVLFHIVQKVLLAKYPLVPSNLPVVKTAAAITGIYDNRLPSDLEEQLKKRQISLVYIHNAINYCLNSYLQDLKRKEEYDTKHNNENEEEMAEEYYGESFMPEDVPKFVKETQTSGFFGLEFKLSPAAELGRLAYESLHSGEAINSQMLTNILVQYLSTLENINGWVLLNYPELYEDAVNLELGLTGKTNLDAGEKYYLKRVSQLWPRSEVNTSSVGTKSYLTSYVHILRNSRKQFENASMQIINSSATETDSFYTTLGCSNNLTYSTFEPEVIEQAIASILTDKIFQSEIYNALVENTFKTIEEIENERRETERKVSMNKKGTKKKDTKEKSTKKTSKKDKKSVISKREASVVPEGTLQPIRPGELGWNYINMSQSTDIQRLLATMWENTETSYKNSLKQLFLLRRTYNENLLPYFLKIDTYFSNFIEKNTDVQEHVHVFQEYFNSLLNFYREDDEFKAELHCRIDELKIKLVTICDQKRTDAENERQRLIRENWFANQAVAILNVYIHIMHTELYRSMQTLQFIQDYYTSMVQQTLIDTKVKNPSLDLLKNNDSKICNAVATYFIDSNTNLEFIDKQMHSITNNNNNTINNWYSVAMENVNKLETKFRGELKPDKRKKSILISSETVELLKNIELFKQEYQSAINEEYARVKFRINLICTKAVIDIKELLSNGKTLFDNLNKRLIQKYQSELDNINAICQIFANGVELCENIEPRVLIK